MTARLFNTDALYAKHLWLIFLGFVMCDVVTYGLAAMTGYGAVGPPASILGLLSIIPNSYILPAPETYNPRNLVEDVELTRRATAMAERLGVPPPQVNRLVKAVEGYGVNAFARDGRIFVTSDAVEQMSEPEIGFLLGHEIAHTKRVQERAERLGNTPKVVGYACASSVIIASSVARVEFPQAIRWSGGVMLALTLVFGIAYLHRARRESTRETELWCDRVGAELCGDVDAAISALDKITAGQSDRDAKSGGYPTLNERRDQLRTLSSEI